MTECDLSVPALYVSSACFAVQVLLSDAALQWCPVPYLMSDLWCQHLVDKQLLTVVYTVFPCLKMFHTMYFTSLLRILWLVYNPLKVHRIPRCCAPFRVLLFTKRNRANLLLLLDLPV